MKSHYKRLGDYIREVNVRNRDLAVTRLVGLSIDKIFITSVANTIGTDMSNYKIIRKGQFACSLMQVSRDGKIPVAMLSDDEAIMSPAYPMFEVIDTAILLPEYLMMWFSRSEFDREASFYAVGGVRGSLTWEDFCNLTLPIPAIEVQREIVSEYESLSRRIALNESICDKLEQAAAALYRKTFIDNIDPQNLPHGWRMGTIGEVCNISSSKRIYESEYTNNGIPFYRGKEITQKKKGAVIDDVIFISKTRYNELVEKFGKPTNGDILLTAVGTIGNSYLVEEEDFYFKDGNIIWLSGFISNGFNYYLYDYMQMKEFSSMISEITIGSTQSAITIATLCKQNIIIPSNDCLINYAKNSYAINTKIKISYRENGILNKLQSLLLSKLATN